nr:MAG TPA: hypothetical protein [Caudoviricetes sp.]
MHRAKLANNFTVRIVDMIFKITIKHKRGKLI